MDVSTGLGCRALACEKARIIFRSLEPKGAALPCSSRLSQQALAP